MRRNKKFWIGSNRSLIQRQEMDCRTCSLTVAVIPSGRNQRVCYAADAADLPCTRKALEAGVGLKAPLSFQIPNTGDCSTIPSQNQLAQ